LTYDEFKESYESKVLNIFISDNNLFYNFRNCPHCDFILAIHRHIGYKNNKCPKCKSEFNLDQFTKDYYLGLCEDAKKKGEYNKALNCLNLVIQTDQTDANLWDHRAFILIKLGKHDLAMKSCDKALVIDPNFYNAYYNKACAFSLKKDEIQSIINLQKAINGEPKYKELAKTDSDFDNIRESKEFQKLISI